MKLFALLVVSLMLSQSCGNKSTSSNSNLEQGTAEALKNRTFFEEVGEVHSHNPNIPYRDALLKCIYADTKETSCAINELPMIGLTDKNVTVQKILDRTLISHEFMYDVFKQVLEKLPGDVLTLFASVNAIVISDKISPSFYWSRTGAIYLSGKYFWRNKAEKEIVTQAKDPRASIGQEIDFKFSFDQGYFVENHLVGPPYANSNSRTIQEIYYNLVRLLFHELTHSIDVFNSNTKALAEFDQSKSYSANTTMISTKNLFICDLLPIPKSSLLYKLALLLNDNEGSIIDWSTVEASQVIDEFKDDTTITDYSYLTQRENLATMIEDALMLHFFNAKSFVTINHNDQNRTIAWGQVNRLKAPQVYAQLKTVLKNVLDENKSQEIISHLDQVNLKTIPANTTFEEISKF